MTSTGHLFRQGETSAQNRMGEDDLGLEQIT